MKTPLEQATDELNEALAFLSHQRDDKAAKNAGNTNRHDVLCAAVGAARTHIHHALRQIERASKPPGSTAQADGWEAFTKGFSRFDNPHNPYHVEGTEPEFHQWDTGWTSANDQYKD